MGTMMMFRIMGLRMFMALKSNLVMAHPIKRIIILPFCLNTLEKVERPGFENISGIE